MSRVAAVTGGSLVRSGLLACLVVVGALALPASSLASTAATVATNDGPQPLTTSQELVSGTINPHGLTTRYFVEYAAANATWCTSGGTQGTPTKTPTAQLNYSDSNNDPASVTVQGLSPNTSYCAELAATNSAGTVAGPDGATGLPATFTAGVPFTTTTAANVTGAQQVTIQGTVDPASQATSYVVAYDYSSSTWCTSGGTSGSPSYVTSPGTSLPNLDGAQHTVSVNVTRANTSPALFPGTDYCAAIAASNGTDTTNERTVSVPQSFTTEPADTTGSVESINATTAQINGTVNPDGVSTTYDAAYAPVSSDWCQTQGATGGPTARSAPQTLTAEDQNAHSETVTVPNLNSGETYCFEMESTNQPLGTYDEGPTSAPLTVGFPTATTSSNPTPDAPTTAVVAGTVSPAGQTTQYEVLYDLQGSSWCTNGGTQGAATYNTVPQTLPEADSGTYNVGVEMTNLIPGDGYCAELAAINSSTGQNHSPAQSVGSMMSFVAGIAPTSSAPTVTDQSGSTSTVSGTVNGEGQSASYQVDYDVATSDWCNGSGSPADVTNPAQSVSSPADANDHTVSVSLTGLNSGTAYCAAIVVDNQSGQSDTSSGFQTEFVAGQPSASSSGTGPLSATSETLTGTVTPTGQATTYYAAYDTASSLWCQNGGGDPSSASYPTTPPISLGYSDDTAHAVSVTLPNLAPGVSYCAEIVASNSSVNYSSVQTFTAGYPFSVSTIGTGTPTTSSVTVGGTVNPAGLPTTYWVAYDLQTSDWCSSGGSSDDPGMSTTPVSLPADTNDHAVSVSLAGLQPGTAYCAAIVAENDSGTLDGAQVSFTTGGTAGVTGTAGTGSGGGSGTGGGGGSGGSGTTSPSRNAPSHMAIRAASATSPSGALVTASINPDGERTIYDAAFAPASSRFCVSNGQKGIASRTSFQAMRQTDFSAHTVTAPIAGLYSGSRYCAEIIAQNASGQTASVIAVFTTIGHPRLTDLRLGSSVLRPGSHGHAIRILYRESQAGTVTFTVARRAARCTNRSHICAGPVVGRFTRRAHAGRDSFTFAGQLGGKSLTRGGYVLEAVIRNRWQLSSGRMTVAFSVR